eukprot:c6276_g1_i1.p1 GENE.c6276_g1_i1~~c6276_g1_i1.p1  ORF type:complete len:337 (-),score=87.33 c6276_g1_i1:349-1326(-)
MEQPLSATDDSAQNSDHAEWVLTKEDSSYMLKYLHDQVQELENAYNDAIQESPAKPVVDDDVPTLTKEDSAYMIKFLQSQVDMLETAYQEAVQDAEAVQKAPATDKAALDYLHQQVGDLENAYADACSEVEDSQRTVERLKQELAELKAQKKQAVEARKAKQGDDYDDDADDTDNARVLQAQGTIRFLQDQVNLLENDFDEETKDFQRQKEESRALALQLEETRQKLQEALAKAEGNKGDASTGNDDELLTKQESIHALSFLSKKVEELVVEFEAEVADTDELKRRLDAMENEKKQWALQKEQLIKAASSGDLNVISKTITEICQ